MAKLLDIFGFVSILLRGFCLSSQSVLIGGIVFMLLIGRSEGMETVTRGCRRLAIWAAAVLAVAQLSYIAADSAILMETAGLRLAEAAGADFFLTGASAALLSISIGILLALERRWSAPLSLVLSAGILLGSVMTSHAAARPEGRLVLALLTGLHQAATACWVGGIPFLVIALARGKRLESIRPLISRFSRLAQASVSALLLAGVGLSLKYVDTPAAMLGTAYGAMITAKAAMLGLMLLLGGFNFMLVRRARSGDQRPLERIRRFSEVEVGIGFTVILAAASLTSQPPAVDLISNRVPLAEIVERISPRMPRLKPPSPNEVYPPEQLARAETVGLQSYVPGQAAAPPTPGEIALSEFNHNVAGLVVLLSGLLAMAACSGCSWARIWPLSFLVLAFFLILMADADYQPMGPINFWKGFAVSEVLQHRLVIPLVAAFAIFEWKVQAGRVSGDRAKLVFPAVCVICGALLLTHTHSLNNVKEELLAELSHIPIALFAIIAGWSRWLELRMPDAPKRILSWIWPVCFVLIGAVLLLYRES